MNNDLSTSAFISPASSGVGTEFTERRLMASKSFNILVRAKRYGRWWVLKGLKEEYRDQTAYRLLLKKEYDLLSQLTHPNVVSVNSIENVDALGPCIVMEWIDGYNLSTWLTDGTQHDRRERLSVARQLISALKYIHSRQIVHRDLKPSNIMVTDNGSVVKLIDFGLSDADSYTLFKQPAGTEGYISPEQRAGGKPDVRNDIYSLGRILSDLRLGTFVRPVIRRCMMSVEKRYNNVGEVSSALTRALRTPYYILAFGMLILLTACASLLFNGNTKVNDDKPENPIAVDSSRTSPENNTKQLDVEKTADSKNMNNTPADSSSQRPASTGIDKTAILNLIKKQPKPETTETAPQFKDGVFEAWLAKNLANPAGNGLISGKDCELSNDAVLNILPWIGGHMNNVDKKMQKRIDTLTCVRYIIPYIDAECDKMASFNQDYAFSYEKQASTYACTMIQNTLNRFVNDFYYAYWMSLINKKNIPMNPK